MKNIFSSLINDERTLFLSFLISKKHFSFSSFRDYNVKSRKSSNVELVRFTQICFNENFIWINYVGMSIYITYNTRHDMELYMKIKLENEFL